MRGALTATAFGIAALASPSHAMAHVVIAPATTAPGADQEFTMRVPNERDVPTTRLVVTFPADLTVFSFAPSPGWRRQVLLSSDRRVRGAIFSGGSVPVQGYDDFRFLGVATRPGTYIWSVQQIYADGKSKPWTGPPEGGGAPESGPTAPGPAPVTRVLAGVAPAGSVAPAGATSSPSSGAGVWLGLIAIALAAAAVLCTGFLWSTRPAELPSDREDPDPGEHDDPNPEVSAS